MLSAISAVRPPKILARILVATAVLCAPAQADPAGDKTLLLLTNPDSPPYVEKEADGRLGGLFTDLVSASLAAGGVSFEIHAMPWKRIYRELAAGNADGSFAWAGNPRHHDRFIVSRPFYHNSWSMFTWRTDIDTFGDLKRLPSLPEEDAPLLCLPHGWTMPDWLDRLMVTGRISRATPNDITHCFQLLARGRVAFAFGPDILTHNEIDKALATLAPWTRPDLRELPMEDAAVSGTMHVLFAKSPDKSGVRYRDAFDRGLAAIIADGTYEALVRKRIAGLPARTQSDVLRRLAAEGFVSAPSGHSMAATP